MTIENTVNHINQAKKIDRYFANCATVCLYGLLPHLPSQRSHECFLFNFGLPDLNIPALSFLSLVIQYEMLRGSNQWCTEVIPENNLSPSRFLRDISRFTNTYPNSSLLGAILETGEVISYPELNAEESHMIAVTSVHRNSKATIIDINPPPEIEKRIIRKVSLSSLDRKISRDSRTPKLYAWISTPISYLIESVQVTQRDITAEMNMLNDLISKYHQDTWEVHQDQIQYLQELMRSIGKKRIRQFKRMHNTQQELNE